MKTIQKISALFLVATSLFLSSCSKDDNPAPVVPIQSKGTMTAKVNGGATKSLSIRNCNFTTGVLTLQASSLTTGETIQLQIYDVTELGTYDLHSAGLGNANALYTPGISGIGVAYNSEGCGDGFPVEGFVPNGTITITELSETKVVGTFYFDAAKLEDCGTIKNISEGTFNGKF